MGVQPNATSHKSDAQHWQGIDFEKAKRTVQTLQERIVQATKKGKWRQVISTLLSRRKQLRASQLFEGWVVNGSLLPFPCLSRMR